MWKRNTKIFSVLFSHKLDDLGLMGMAKIGATTATVQWRVHWSLQFSDSFNSRCTTEVCLKGLHMIQFSGLCVFRACALLNGGRFKG